ncbi:unnamed protein product [Adineta steineri]|uniref:Uncharacterized protein n=1 Tax=Adineta steineri TaxID=433720 RepID=A0A819C8K4_9BILA|nr:unnamed protein product [Adineta steineri]CAF3803705.1 unnamed protein product [Adineta steineri]
MIRHKKVLNSDTQSVELVRAEIARETEKLIEATNALDEVQSKVQLQEDKVEKIRGHLDRLGVQDETLTENIRSMTAKLESKGLELQNNREAIREMNEAIRDSREQYEIAQRKVTTAKTNLTSLKTQMKANATEVQTSARNFSKLTRALGFATDESNCALEDMKVIQEKLVRLMQERTNIRERHHKYQQECDQKILNSAEQKKYELAEQQNQYELIRNRSPASNVQPTQLARERRRN